MRQQIQIQKKSLQLKLVAINIVRASEKVKSKFNWMQIVESNQKNANFIHSFECVILGPSEAIKESVTKGQ